MFIEMLFKMLLLKGGVLIYAEHCTLYIHVYTFISEKSVSFYSVIIEDLEVCSCSLQIFHYYITTF